MQQPLTQMHVTDENGNPAGGITTGKGLEIHWQNGPLMVEVPAKDRSGTVFERREPNGAFVEGVIQAAIGRLEHYQASKFACVENEAALRWLNIAMDVLQERTANREARGVEGTHEL